MTLSRVVLAAVVLSTTAACYPIWTGNRLEERVDALDNATRENRAKQDAFHREIDARLAKLEQTLEQLSKASHLTTAEVGVQVAELARQGQLLRGELEEAKFRFDDVGKRIDTVERRVAALGGDRALESLEAKKALSQIERPHDKAAFFALARSYHEKKEYSYSRPLFAEFIEKWKFDDRAPQAQLLIGDSYFDEGQYRPAILEYQKIRETWPKSKQLPDSLYKLGLSFAELKLMKEAKLFLTEAAKYTGQPAGKAARAKLKELGGR